MKEAAAAYQAASQYFLNLARAVTPDLMDVHAENEWSARQCIHHMADSEAQSYAKFGEHTEAGKYTIARWLETYTKHPYDHGDQMVRATKGQA